MQFVTYEDSYEYLPMNLSEKIKASILRYEMSEAKGAHLDTRWGPIVAEFPSSSRPGKNHEVRRKQAGEYSCNCEGWGNHKHCWHTEAVAAKESGLIGSLWTKRAERDRYVDQHGVPECKPTEHTEADVRRAKVQTHAVPTPQHKAPAAPKKAPAPAVAPAHQQPHAAPAAASAPTPVKHQKKAPAPLPAPLPAQPPSVASAQPEDKVAKKRKQKEDKKTAALAIVPTDTWGKKSQYESFNESKKFLIRICS